MALEAGHPAEAKDERAHEKFHGHGVDPAALSRNTWAGVESNGKKSTEPTSGSLRFDDKPIFPNQQYAGLTINNIATDAGGAASNRSGDGKPGLHFFEAPEQPGHPDSVVSKNSKHNSDGGSTDTSRHSSGSIDTTTYDKNRRVTKNRTDNPDGSFNEQTLDKNNNLKVREQKANGDFTETNITNDGKVTSKGRTTNADGGHTDVATGATGITDSTTYTKDGKLEGKKSQNPDGSYTERKVNPDGSVVFHDQQKNGSYVETITDKNGTSKTVHDVDQEGGSTTKTFDAKGDVVADRVTQPDGSYFETTKNKDGTTTKHDQKKNGDFSEAILNNKGELVSPVLDAKHTASAEFIQKVRDDIAKLPESVRHLLAKDGTHIAAAGMVLDAIPDAAGETPRGHAPGSTWNDLDGMQNSGKKLVVVAERSTEGLSQRTDGVLNHETGHAVDRILGYPSRSPEFEAAYNKDVAAMTPDVQKREQYLLQTGVAGRSEAFAEVFGAVNGSSANPSETSQVLQTYPNLVEYMKKRMNEVPN